ncbi:MAG: ATP-NAD kinase family protein [Candidatus Bathyarchaeia archaeon]
MNRIGFIVNPIAGMGGAVGLKGTDGRETYLKAVSLGARPIAPKRAEAFLSEIKSLEKNVEIYSGAASMGEYNAERCGFKPRVVGERKEETSSEDTKKTASMMKDLQVDILVFCGGDGTSRDIYDAIDTSIPVLGIPAGVKMYSAVFSTTPLSAARVVSKFLRGSLPLKEAEVLDADEESIRRGELKVRLYGYLLTPYEPSLTQGTKVSTLLTEDEMLNQLGIAKYVVEEMEPEVIYVVGPGTTTREILGLLGEEKTLLGVDIIKNRKIIAKDATEKEIIELIKDKKSKIIVSPIGGQGFIFGRGNLQISDKVIREIGKENIIVVATKEKLNNLKVLRVDTGDPELDLSFKGFIRVISDYREERVVMVE